MIVNDYYGTLCSDESEEETLSIPEKCYMYNTIRIISNSSRNAGVAHKMQIFKNTNSIRAKTTNYYRREEKNTIDRFYKVKSIKRSCTRAVRIKDKH